MVYARRTGLIESRLGYLRFSQARGRNGEIRTTLTTYEQAAEPTACGIMLWLHRRMKKTALKPEHQVKASYSCCDTQLRIFTTTTTTYILIIPGFTHMHINMQHTLSCSSAPPATAPCAAPLSFPLSLYSLQPRSLTISGMVLSSRWISSRPGTSFCAWLLPRVCDADDGDDWGLLSCHR